MSTEIENSPLPIGWAWTTVGEIAQDIQYGYTASATPEPCGAKFLRITDIQENHVDWYSVPYCKIDDDEKSKYLLHERDLVFARTGATVGKSFLIKGNIPESVFASYLIRICPDPWINESFISNFFQSQLYWSQIHEGKAGIGQPNVNASKLSRIKLPLPPLHEQHLIVNKIEDLFTKLDAGVDELRRAKVRIRRYRQSILNCAFEGKLTKDWRRNHNNQHPSEKNLRIPESSELRYLPTGWHWATLNQCAEAIDPQPSHRTPPKVEGGIPYISIQDFNKDSAEINFSGARKVSKTVLEEHIDRYALDEGDFIIGKIGTIGKSYFIPTDRTYTLSANIVLVKPIASVCIPKYLYYAFRSQSLEHQFASGSVATSQAAFGIQKVRKLRVPFCSMEEQGQVVNEIEYRMSLCDQLLKSIEYCLNRSNILRNQVLNKAFSGHLVPQCLDDEPADKLIMKMKDYSKGRNKRNLRRKSNGDTPNGK